MLLLLLSLGSLLLKNDCIKDALLFYILMFHLVLKLLTFVSSGEKKSDFFLFLKNYAIKAYVITTAVVVK